MTRVFADPYDTDELRALHDAGWRPSAGRTSCPDPALLVAVDGGALDDATARAVRAHVAACEVCQVLQRDLAHVLDAETGDDVRERIRTRVLTAPPAAAPRSRWVIVAAGLTAAAAVAGVFIARTWRVEIPAVTPPDVAAYLARAEPPTILSADRPAVAAPEIELDVRGATSVSVADRVSAALDRAESGAIPAAVSALAALAAEHPDSVDAHLALGAVRLRAGQPREALDAIDRARALDRAHERVDELDWFDAIALTQTRQTDRAIAVLQSLCARDSWRGALGCAGLAELRRPPRQ